MDSYNNTKYKTQGRRQAENQDQATYQRPRQNFIPNPNSYMTRQFPFPDPTYHAPGEFTSFPSSHDQNGSYASQTQAGSISAEASEHPFSLAALLDQRSRSSVTATAAGPTSSGVASSASSQETIRPPIHTVTFNNTAYKVVQILQAPSNRNSSMSHGVRLLQHPNGTMRVEKRLSMTGGSRKACSDAEMEALHQIVKAGGSNHINVFHEASWLTGASYGSLLLEHCDSGTIQDYVMGRVNPPQLVDESFCWHVLQGLCAALAMCHNGIKDPIAPQNKPPSWNMIAHLDIKPANVFLSSKGVSGFQNAPWPRVVLGDFGCAVSYKDILSGRVSREVVPHGTPGWMAPETEPDGNGVPRARYGWKTDIWQMGGVIQVLCLRSAEPDLTRIGAGRPCGTAYSSDLNNVISHCMKPDLNSRPTAVDVAQEVRRQMVRRGL